MKMKIECTEKMKKNKTETTNEKVLMKT